jgi:hypothetical protein
MRKEPMSQTDPTNAPTTPEEEFVRECRKQFDAFSRKPNHAMFVDFATASLLKAFDVINSLQRRLAEAEAARDKAIWEWDNAELASINLAKKLVACDRQVETMRKALRRISKDDEIGMLSNYAQRVDVLQRIARDTLMVLARPAAEAASETAGPCKCGGKGKVWVMPGQFSINGHWAICSACRGFGDGGKTADFHYGPAPSAEEVRRGE